MSLEQVYTIVSPSEGNLPTLSELSKQIEKGNDTAKYEALKQLIHLLLQGEDGSSLLMVIIRFIMPTKDKRLKKLLHFYWEVCNKYNLDGKLKQEMILVCNAIRNDLQHPNEFIRGATLRFLSKLRDPELLEPLVPSCRACLEHRLSYVRKNAVVAIHSIYKHQPNLIPDAPELIQSFLAAEPDATCKRNAFIMLSSVAPDLASSFIKTNYEAIQGYDEILQLAILEHIRKDAVTNIKERAKYIQTIAELLNVNSPSVVFEAATILPLLTLNTVALKSSGSSLLQLAAKESDNNVKLIVLDRFAQLSKKHSGLFQPLIMDLLRVLTSSPDIDVRSKVLEIMEQLISKRNVEEVIIFLQKELTKSQHVQYEKNVEYRELLIHAIHACAIRFPEIAGQVINVLIEFLSENTTSTAVDVVSFVREVAEKFPELRSSILSTLLASFIEIKTSRALRGALWVIGEYAMNEEIILLAWEKIRESLGEIPIVSSEMAQMEKLQDSNSNNEPSETNPSNFGTSARRVNADGTYATESSFTSTQDNSNLMESLKNNNSLRPPLRNLLMKGDYFIGSVLSSTLVKLVLQLEKLNFNNLNHFKAEAMLIMTSIIRLGQSQFTQFPIDNDNYERIISNLKLLSQLNNNNQFNSLKSAFGEDTKQAYSKLLDLTNLTNNNLNNDELKSQRIIQVDEPIQFKLLINKDNLLHEDNYQQDLTLATGELASLTNNSVTKLDKIISLSGYSDAIYCEAIIEVVQFDIYLEILMVNMTEETLQNVQLELATLGDLKLIEKPSSISLAPLAFHSTRASIKVSSTETGVIFGNLIYESSKVSGEINTIVLNEIHLDIMDYIRPNTTTLRQFQSMWTEFEWENKVNLQAKMGLTPFLQLICNATNLKPLVTNLEDECDFLSTNLYAKTLFGEDALANLSVELKDGLIIGHIRIRSKAQGLALALGDRVSGALKQLK